MSHWRLNEAMPSVLDETQDIRSSEHDVRRRRDGTTRWWPSGQLMTPTVDRPSGSRGYDRRALRRTFERFGYLRLTDIGVSTGDLAEVQRMLDALFDRYQQLPPDIAHERALNLEGDAVLMPEILQCTRLQPELLETRVYKAIEALAADLLGGTPRMIFDHALYKPPGPSAPTAWHQDSAYGRDTGLAVWLPLQSTDLADGCMRYVPFSHLDGNRRHALHSTADGKQIWYLEDRFVETLDPVSVPVPLGGVAVHHRKTIHGAWPNVGAQLRRAWITVFSRPTSRQRVIRRLRAMRPAGAAGRARRR